jgi:prevent-host-death family protein
MASPQHPNSPVFHRLFQPAVEALAASETRYLCHRIPDEDYHAAAVHDPKRIDSSGTMRKEASQGQAAEPTPFGRFPARQAGFPCDALPMNPTWPLQEAKNKLSELIDRVSVEGAQTITRHGRPVAVVVSAQKYARLQPEETLADILLDCPVKDWEIERADDVERDLAIN